MFVDALPFDSHEHLHLADTFTVRPMNAGTGYSVNAKAEIFAGLVPDDLGLLNEYTYRDTPQHSWRRHLSPLDRWPLISWLVRRVLRKLTGGGQVHNIPFAVEGNFERKGMAAYEDDFGVPTVLDGFDAKILYSSVKGKDRDAAVWRRVQALPQATDSVFVAFPDLDRDLHQGSVGDLEARLKVYGSFANELACGYDTVVLVSDHGMIPMNRLIDLWSAARELELKYGDSYFIDSTMVRVWSDHPDDWSSMLRDNNVRLLSPEERETYGVSDPNFGTIIGIASDGDAFSPNSYGRMRNFVPGQQYMHGYHPDSVAQKGIVAVCGLDRNLDEKGLRPVEVHQLLTELAGSKD